MSFLCATARLQCEDRGMHGCVCMCVCERGNPCILRTSVPRERMLSCEGLLGRIIQGHQKHISWRERKGWREGGRAVQARDGEEEGGMARAEARDAEGKRWYIHSSSGIYSRLRGEEREGAWLGLWLAHWLAQREGEREGMGGERELWCE